VVDLQLGVADGDLGFGLAAAAGQPPVAGALAGAGLAGRDGGLAGDGGQVPVAFLGSGPAGALAGLVVQRGLVAGNPGSPPGRLPRTATARFARFAARRGRVIRGPSARQTADRRADPAAAPRRCRFCPSRRGRVCRGMTWAMSNFFIFEPRITDVLSITTAGTCQQRSQSASASTSFLVVPKLRVSCARRAGSYPRAPGSSPPSAPCRCRCRTPGPGTAARRSPLPRLSPCSRSRAASLPGGTARGTGGERKN
jgi:hypothetical protein